MTALRSTHEIEIPHLSGPASLVRHAMAAHFVTDCAHIVEIGGHLRPVTPYLTHRPQSVTVIDPKVVPYCAAELNGHPCRVRHVAKKFQDVDIAAPPGEYGLIILGCSLKPYGAKEPVGEALFQLIDRAKVTVIEYSPALERAASQVPHLLDRGTLTVRCTIDLTLDDELICGSAYAVRRFSVLDPARPGGCQ